MREGERSREGEVVTCAKRDHHSEVKSTRQQRLCRFTLSMSRTVEGGVLQNLGSTLGNC